MDATPSQVEVLNDTEGIVWGLYYHLWKKTHQGEPCPNVSIPHTVIYQDSTPHAWYFTSGKDGRIYRKKKCNVSGPAICETMQAHKQPKLDACAWFSGTMTHMAASPKKKHKNSEPVYELQPQEDDKEPACFDYFSKDRLQRLVAPGQYTQITESIYDGILQKYITPRESYDHVIRAIWSPTACVCERRCSNFSLTDEMQPLKDRMASFDANTFWLSTHQPLPAGSVLVQRITSTCESIVKHLAATSQGRISVARIQLFFKVDTHNRIWLTMCNSLRLNRTVLAVDRPPSVSRQYTTTEHWKHESDTRLPQDTADFMCVLTGKMYAGSQRCDVSYKMLLQAWFAECDTLAEESDRLMALDNIPPAIRRANPNITRDYYLRMRAQPAFLLKTAPVCASEAALLTRCAIQDLSRIITRPRSALADSASSRQLTTNTLNDALMRHARLQHSRMLNGPGGALKLLLNTGPPPPPPSDPNVYYEPGQVIPSQLLPKSASGARSMSPGSRPISRHTHFSMSQASSHVFHSSVVPPPPLAPRSAWYASPAGAQTASMTCSPVPSACPTLAGSPSARKGMQAAASQQQGTSATQTGQSGRMRLPVAKGSRAASKKSVAIQATASGCYKGAASDAATQSDQAKAQRDGADAGRTSRKVPAGSGAASGRSTAAARKAHVSSEDMRALKELSDAYASAEAVTQQLLAEAQSLLTADGGPPLPALVPSSSVTASRAHSGKVSIASSKAASGRSKSGSKSRPTSSGRLPSLNATAKSSPYAPKSRPTSARHRVGFKPLTLPPGKVQAGPVRAALAALLPRAGGLEVGGDTTAVPGPLHESKKASIRAGGVEEGGDAKVLAAPVLGSTTAAGLEMGGDTKVEPTTAQAGASAAVQADVPVAPVADADGTAPAAKKQGAQAPPAVATVAAGLTSDEAAMLSEALQES